MTVASPMPTAPAFAADPFKHRALCYGGDFTLLWHHSHLTTARDRDFYQALVA